MSSEAMLMEPQARGATGAVAPAPLEEKDLPKGASEGGTAGRGAPWGQCPGEAASWAACASTQGDPAPANGSCASTVGTLSNRGAATSAVMYEVEIA